MGGGEGSKGNLKNEEAEQVGGLEPDPRYIRCCSAVCRPGYALRDALLGLLVLLGLSVVVTVIFVVCFYVIPDEKQLIDEGILSGTAKGVIGGPEHLNEVTLREGDKYTLPPHNFDDGGLAGGDFGDIHEGLSQDFSTFAPPSGGVQDTTDPALDLQDENPEGESAQDLPVVHHENKVPEESLQPRENFDLHLPEESNDTEPKPNVGPQDGPDEVIEEGPFQRDGDEELQGSRVNPEEPADSVALQEEEQEGCSPVQLPMCISSVPWTLAGSPNWLNHTSEGEMFAALPYIRSSLLDSGCSSLAPLYACSVLEPPCRNSQVLPPCRAFCEEVAQSCQPFVQGASLPGLFHCSRYPDSADPSICISAQQDVEELSDSEGPSSHSNLSEPSNDAANLHTGATRQQHNRISPYDYNEYTDNISTEDRRAVFGDVIRPEDEKVEAKQQPLNLNENQPQDHGQQNFVNEPARHQSVERKNPPIAEKAIPELPVHHQFGEAEQENPAISNLSSQQILPIQTEAANNPSPEGLFDISDLLGVQGNASYYKEVLGALEEETSLAICTLDMFMCNDGSDCINNTFVCDQVQNCVDNSDETNCSAVLKECSGDDDFRCSTTGLCVPSSWLCDGADDCRDNSDEQNCPLTPGNDKTDLNTDDTDPLATYGDAEYSDTNADHLDEEYHAETPGSRIPHLGYPHFDPEDASTINDPALAGPSLNDPSLLEAAYRQENEEQDNLASFQSEVPLQETAEKDAASAESTGKERQSQEFPISKAETSRRRRPGRRNNSNSNKDGLNQSDVINSSANIDSNSDAREHSDNRDNASSGKEDDLYTDYSVRNDHFQNHPIPDVDYPARETFSVDSTSSVDQKYHQMSGDKIEDESAYKDDDEGAATDNQDDSITPDVRTPSQRLRERLSGSNRSRQNTNSPVTRQQRPTSTIEKAENEEASTVEPNQKPTRPPSRLANFQDRFREWRDKRRPTLPSDLENLSPGRNSPAPGTPGTGRPYDLVRRRPQRITTPKLEPTEGVELLRESVNRGNKQRQETGGDFLESSNIRQPIALPKTVIPDQNHLNSASPVAELSEKETIGARPTRFRPGFRFRQQSRQQTDGNSENERPLGEKSSVRENDEIEDNISEKVVLPEEVSGQLPGREFYGQPSHEDTNHDQEPIKSNRPSIIPDRLLLEDEHNINPEEDQEQSEQRGEANPDDEFYKHEDHDTSYSETIGSVPSKEPINKEPFDYHTQEENFENEYHEPESLPSELHSQREDTYAGQDRYQYSNEYGTNDDGAVYTQQSGEDEPYRPPEYRPQRAYEQHNYQERQQPQEPIRQTTQRFPQPQGTRPQGHRPSSGDNSQLNLPNDFRVSFPPPRSVRPLQQAVPQRPVRPHQQTAGASNSFYNSEDAISSDLLYDVQGVNEQQYPTYQQPPIRRPEAYGSPYAGQQAF